jgi:hypothetical protein
VANETEAEKSPAPARARKMFVLWAVALVLLAAVGLSMWLVVLPFRRARAALDELASGMGATTSTDISPGDARAAIKKLGGPYSASRSVGFYLRAPKRFAPNKAAAVSVLKRCGSHAVPHLVLALAQENRGIRIRAIRALAYIGPDASNAVPALKDAAEWPHLQTRYSALNALRDIAGEAPVQQANAADVEQIHLNYMLSKSRLNVLVNRRLIESDFKGLRKGAPASYRRACSPQDLEKLAAELLESKLFGQEHKPMPKYDPWKVYALWMVLEDGRVLMRYVKHGDVFPPKYPRATRWIKDATNRFNGLLGPE